MKAASSQSLVPWKSCDVRNRPICDLPECPREVGYQGQCGRPFGPERPGRDLSRHVAPQRGGAQRGPVVLKRKLPLKAGCFRSSQAMAEFRAHRHYRRLTGAGPNSGRGADRKARPRRQERSRGHCGRPVEGSEQGLGRERSGRGQSPQAGLQRAQSHIRTPPTAGNRFGFPLAHTELRHMFRNKPGRTR